MDRIAIWQNGSVESTALLCVGCAFETAFEVRGEGGDVTCLASDLTGQCEHCGEYESQLAALMSKLGDAPSAVKHAAQQFHATPPDPSASYRWSPASGWMKVGATLSAGYVAVTAHGEVTDARREEVFTAPGTHEHRL